VNLHHRTKSSDTTSGIAARRVPTRQKQLLVRALPTISLLKNTEEAARPLDYARREMKVLRRHILFKKERKALTSQQKNA
jgi:hypothetical protein